MINNNIIILTIFIPFSSTLSFIKFSDSLKQFYKVSTIIFLPILQRKKLRESECSNSPKATQAIRQ